MKKITVSYCGALYDKGQSDKKQAKKEKAVLSEGGDNAAVEAIPESEWPDIEERKSC